MADTIAAVATGGALAAIGILRLSGDRAIQIAERVFFPKSGRPLGSYPDRQLVYGAVRDAGGRVLDMGLATVSRSPGSYTGEDTAELQLHGSPTVLAACLEMLFACGARQALAGEFTKRAFLNGRMDLTQAEAVIDLIHAETAAAAYLAAGQLEGNLFRRAEAVYDELTDIMSHFHAVLDYPDEEIEPFQMADYAARLAAAERELGRMLDSYRQGRLVREGVKTAIVGKPNVGKSSLLNALLGYERAIVTDVPGTTRDTVSEKLVLGGVLLDLTDTAGLRETADAVERLGVARSHAAARGAELVLAVFDGSAPLTAEDEAVLAVSSGHTAVALINKSDLPCRLSAEALAGCFDHVLRVSARTGQGLEALAALAPELFPAPEAGQGTAVLTNARQAEAVLRAKEAVAAARAAAAAGMTPDAALCGVEDALSALGELTGRTVREDVTARIFERFCVGK